MTLRLSALAVVMMVACAPALAREHLVIGVEDLDYKPAYTMEGNSYGGYAREFLDTFAAENGYSLTYRALPVPRLYAEFFNGQIAFKFPDNPNWSAGAKEGKAIVYSGPVARFRDATVVPADKLGQPISTLGTVTGFTPWVWLDAINAGKVRLSENADFSALVRQVLAGRIQGAYASIAVVNYQLDKVLDKPGALVYDPSLPNSLDTYRLSTISRPDVVAQLDGWMARNAERIADMKARHAVEKGVD